MHFAGRAFSSLIASDAVRDGMLLEIWEHVAGEEKLVGEVFFSDQTHQFSVSLLEENLPLELIEFMSHEARERLVPIQEIVGGK